MANIQFLTPISGTMVCDKAGTIEGDIIIATIMTNVSTLGQTEEWLLLDIKDVYRQITDLTELKKLM